MIGYMSQIVFLGRTTFSGRKTHFGAAHISTTFLELPSSSGIRIKLSWINYEEKQIPEVFLRLLSLYRVDNWKVDYCRGSKNPLESDEN